MTAPTTAEVRERIERLRHERDARMTGERAKTVSLGEVASMSAYALPLAEERDALAAEVARLRADIELFQRASSQAEQTRRDLATRAEVAEMEVHVAHRMIDDAASHGRSMLAALQARADAAEAEVGRLTGLLDGLAAVAAKGSQAKVQAAIVACANARVDAIYNDWRTRMAGKGEER